MPSRLGDREHAIVVVTAAEVERGGGATAQQLGDSQLCGGLDAVAVERRLVGPGAIAKPRQQLDAVGLVAQQRLDDVDVALDEPGQHHGVRAVQGSAGRDPGPALPRTISSDARRLGSGGHPSNHSSSSTIGITVPPRMSEVVGALHLSKLTFTAAVSMWRSAVVKGPG